MMICQACGGIADFISLSHPVDYEYQVVPAREFQYRRCNACATEWIAPRPESDELPPFYPPGYHAHNEGHGFVAGMLVWLRAQLRGRLYRSLLNGNRQGALFDVGAGDCRHFVELRRFADWRFAGVEIQAAVAQKARDDGFDVETGTLENMNIERHIGQYDVVSLNHVLEHVCDPNEVIARCWQLLKPGGRLIGQLPTNSAWESHFGKTWAGYHYPRHLQVFSRSGLRQLLINNRFDSVHISSAPHCQTAISMQNFLIEKGISLQLAHGRSKVYGSLLLFSLPFEFLAWLCNRSGTIDFKARK